jgi:cytoplasmic iron level regulating protein YaaA (DUF328/UPF0246 family)
MRILLPPSEAKRPGGGGAAIELGRDPLGAARRRAAKALVAAAGRRGAAVRLALPARSAEDELAADRAVLQAPTMPGLDRYNGVVYDGLDAPSLPLPARARADAAILIFSGLWGVVRADEGVPNYRLAAATAVPPLGIMATFWRPVLARVVPALLGDGLVIDLRSSDYATMWRPGPELRERVVTVRVLSQREGLPPAVISYPSKLGKGRLACALVERPTPVTGIDELIHSWIGAGGTSGELTATGVDLLI